MTAVLQGGAPVSQEQPIEIGDGMVYSLNQLGELLAKNPKSYVTDIKNDERFLQIYHHQEDPSKFQVLLELGDPESGEELLLCLSRATSLQTIMKCLKFDGDEERWLLDEERGVGDRCFLTVKRGFSPPWLFFPQKGGMGINERAGGAKTERRPLKRSREHKLLYRMDHPL
jgi:hypothetical protein